MILLVASLAILQLPPAVYTAAPAERQEMIRRREAGLAELKSIDRELHEMRSNADVLLSDASVRREQVRSLRLRYPDIQITDSADAQTIYGALFLIRKKKADELRPLAETLLQLAHRDTCEAALRVSQSRSAAEASNEFLSLSLADRLTWRKSFDDLLRLTGANDCADQQSNSKR